MSSKNTVSTKSNRKDSVVSTRSSVDSKSTELTKELNALKLKLKLKEEEIIRIKTEKNDVVSNIHNFNSLQDMRSEISMADAFFQMLMKENLMTYQEDSIETSPEKKTLTTSFLKDNSTQRYSCNCHTCSVVFKAFKDDKNVRTSKVSKHVMLSKSVMMALNFEPKYYTYENHVNENNTKNLKLIPKDKNQSPIRITFTMAKTRVMKIEEFDFSKNASIKINESLPLISYSAMMVIEAMRSLKSIDGDYKISIMENTTAAEGYNNCFIKAMEVMIKDFTYDSERPPLCMNDLTDAQEMIFLTYNKNTMVHVRKTTNKSKKNHIAMEPFDDSMEIFAYMLVTPMFRDVMFYANNEVLSISDSDPKEVEVDTDESAEIFPLLNVYSSGSVVFKTNINLKAKIMKEMDRDNLEYKRYTNLWSVDIKKEMEVFGKSKLINLILPLNPNYVELIKLYHLSFSEFKAIAYFMDSSEDFVLVTVSSSLWAWVTMLNNLNKRIFHAENFRSNNIENDMVTIISDFYSSLDKMSDLNSNLMYNLYKIFKERIVTMMVYLRLSKEMDFHKMLDYTRNKEENFMNLDKFEKLRADMLNDVSISTSLNLENTSNDDEKLNKEYSDSLKVLNIEDMVNYNKNINIMVENDEIVETINKIL